MGVGPSSEAWETLSVVTSSRKNPTLASNCSKPIAPQQGVGHGERLLIYAEFWLSWYCDTVLISTAAVGSWLRQSRFAHRTVFHSTFPHSSARSFFAPSVPHVPWGECCCPIWLSTQCLTLSTLTNCDSLHWLMPTAERSFSEAERSQGLCT